ncbi:biliverdin-producing heme oxygenase [Oxynema aestuarii]|jgi:heme oxygenase|uniref:heme oxygenase (biliverdin-producing) n=1 Tax=Oxynema aestuarii AP17 TaxID=2064643 RepID=A0A6H1TS96_9CYAN|nr:heme oxygenase (biliverdin-producing) [Oxynema aestuarii]QIZ69478.1 heme oxygenase (biliverdin-producing) [Oxynema aestuarii AP17]RMH73904.1 MAG: heme oxygenase (biliverdin-producing) [Cyanobacteria bacterium J007]
MSSNLAIKLRETTKKPHTSSENEGFVKCFLKGVVEPNSLKKLIASLYFVYSALEEEIQRNLENSIVKAMYFHDLNRRTNLEEDLKFYYGDNWRDEIPYLPGAERFVERIREISSEEPELLIAHAYTRYMGDLSGGQSFRKIIQTGLNLEGDRGNAFYNFSNIGDLNAFKGRYRQALNELEVDEAQADRIAAEAERSFKLSRGLFHDLEADLIAAIGRDEFDRLTRDRRAGSTESAVAP